MPLNKRAWLYSANESKRRLSFLMDFSDKQGHTDMLLISVAAQSNLLHNANNFWNVASQNTGGRLPVLHARKDRPQVVHWGLLDRRTYDQLHVDDAGLLDDDSVAALAAETGLTAEDIDGALDMLIDQGCKLWSEWMASLFDENVAG